jgi:hypothetical protein
MRTLLLNHGFGSRKCWFKRAHVIPKNTHTTLTTNQAGGQEQRSTLLLPYEIRRRVYRNRNKTRLEQKGEGLVIALDSDHNFLELGQVFHTS